MQYAGLPFVARLPSFLSKYRIPTYTAIDKSTQIV